jgi:predicted O-methyltransferase YrrM
MTSTPSKTAVPADIYAYMLKQTLRESVVLQELREYTHSTVARAGMQIAPDQGQWMAMMVKLLNAKQIIEVGTYTGYSSLAMAEALPADGRMICCDISDEWTQVARRFWEKAGVSSKITLHLAPAAETLEQLKSDKGDSWVDLIFIDADKPNYRTYYELALALLRPNGLMIIDNVLFHGTVLLPVAEQSENTAAIHALNEFIREDPRVDCVMQAISDGVTLIRKV